MCGFSTLNSILGGQTLATVSNDNLSWTVGIVIIVIISLLVRPLKPQGTSRAEEKLDLIWRV